MSKVATGTIVKVDEEKRLVFGWASVIKDTQDKILLDRQDDFIDSEDELEKAAYEYVLKSRDGGEMHIRKGVSTMVESVVLSQEKQAALGIPSGIVPVGWWVGFKVNDERVWDEVKKGGYVGFSVHGTGKREKAEIAVDKVTEIEKCACDGSPLAAPQPLQKYDARYWTTMRKAQETIVSNAISKARKKAKKNKIATVMREFKAGKLKSSSGKKVTNPKQAMAIAISEQRALAKRGDKPGHPFRGNQWTRVASAGGKATGSAGAKGKAKPTDKKGVVKVKTVEEGIKAILAGKDVELPDVKGAHTLIEELGKMAQKAAAKNPPEKITYDLCKVSVAGTNAFCAGNKGIPRIKMPQAKGEVVAGSKAEKMLKEQNAERAKKGKEPTNEVDGTADFISSLEKAGIKVGEPTKVRADKLKATQRDMQGEKVGGMMQAAKEGKFDPSAEPIFVSRDGYVVDGHHRWAATLGLDMKNGRLGDDYKMSVVVIDAPISKILKQANAWTDQFGIKRKAVAANQKKGK